MTASPLFKQFESGENPLFKALRFVTLAGGILLLASPASWTHLAPADRPRHPHRRARRLARPQLKLLPRHAHPSYGLYLLHLPLRLLENRDHAANFFHDPGSAWVFSTPSSSSSCSSPKPTPSSSCSSALCKPSGRCAARPCRCPTIPTWPAVDLLIPTYNEPLSVVKYTALAAMNIDWPAGKLNVYILDDGNREDFRRFAEEAGIGYITRDDNQHAKAGNINCASPSRLPLRRHLRLRPRPHAQLPADHTRLVPPRQQTGHAPDAAPLLFARSLRAQSRSVPHHPQRGRALLRHRPGRQRFLERHLLLRLLRHPPPLCARRDRRHRRRNGHRRRAHLAAHADERLEHRLHQHSAGRRPRHRTSQRPRQAARSLGARHGPDPAHRQSALCARSQRHSVSATSTR